MRQIDISSAAITARLKLVSQLRRLCLSLGTAKIDPASVARDENVKQKKKDQDKPQKESK